VARIRSGSKLIESLDMAETPLESGGDSGDSIHAEEPLWGRVLLARPESLSARTTAEIAGPTPQPSRKPFRGPA